MTTLLSPKCYEVMLFCILEKYKIIQMRIIWTKYEPKPLEGAPYFIGKQYYGKKIGVKPSI